MITATQIQKEKFKGIFHKWSVRYDLPSVTSNTISDEIDLVDSFSDGTIEAFRIVSPTSTNFDISIRTRAGVVTPSIDEILVITSINQRYSEVNLGIIYTNNDEYLTQDDNDETSSLYMVVNNKDLVNPTGLIQLELIISPA